MFNVGL